MKKCKITIDKIIFEVVLFNSPTANKIWNSLPYHQILKPGERKFIFIQMYRLTKNLMLNL